MQDTIGSSVSRSTGTMTALCGTSFSLCCLCTTGTFYHAKASSSSSLLTSWLFVVLVRLTEHENVLATREGIRIDGHRVEVDVAVAAFSLTRTKDNDKLLKTHSRFPESIKASSMIYSYMVQLNRAAVDSGLLGKCWIHRNSRWVNLKVTQTSNINSLIENANAV